MHSFSSLSATECQDKLQQMYDDVQEAVDSVRRRVPSELNTSACADFLEEWNSPRRQKEHLPASLQLILTRFRSEPNAAIEFRCPFAATTDESPRYLLLMAGFSIEQLVLSMAFHFRHAAEKGVGLAGIIPFIGKDAWNKIVSDLTVSLPWAIGEKDAAAISLLLQEAIEVVPGDPADVFRKVVDWSRDNAQAAIVLDVTGGQKPMDTGGTYAAMYLGARAYYLDFDEYDVRHRRPFPDSLKYVQLVLPSTVFSHDARKAVVELFRHRRFRAAHQRLVELDDEVNAGEVKKYFNQRDKDDVRDARMAVEACNAWMNGNYCHESMASDRLHVMFCDVTRDDVKRKDPKVVLNSMLESFGDPNSPNPRDLLEYLLDEYWRLRTMLYLGDETKAERRCADLQQASDMIREVVVASCALAEVAIDAVFHIPRVDVEVCEVTRVYLEFGNSGAGTKKIKKESNLVREHQNEFGDFIKGTTLPMHRFPHSSTGSKTNLIRGDGDRFRILLPPNEIVKSLNSPNNGHRDVILRVFEGNDDVDPNGKVLEIDVRVKVATRQLLQVDDDIWQSKWGYFGNSQNSEWMKNRNAIAHMRATATQAQLEIARDAVEVYLPRFLGLLSLLAADNPALPVTDGSARKAGSTEIATPRGPWHETEKNETRLRERLRLPN